MEIAEIEQIIEACNFYVASQTQRAETFNVIDAIVEMRKYEGRFNAKRWEYENVNGRGTIEVYSKLVTGTLEDKLAEFAITLFSMANKYKMNVKSLRLDPDSMRDRSFEDLMMSMLKIEMTHYRVFKKIIILIGMLCGYCMMNGIDLLWFVNKRLLINIK